MINTIEVKNFQSHRNTIIDFDPGVNFIVGSSDSGKSSIVRALLWSIYNRPLGDQFKSWFSKEKEPVEVGIEFDNGFVIKERKNSKNIYNINENILEAVKSDIPDELEKLVNLADYNIQTQFQPYFLLQDTPGEVAKKFNELIGLDIIDAIFKNLNHSINNIKGKIIEYDNEINALEIKINSLAYIDDIDVILKKLDLEVGLKEKIEGQCHFIRQALFSIEELDKQISEIDIDPKLLNEIPKILEEIDFYMNKRMEYNAISSILHNLNETEEELIAEIEWLNIEIDYKEINKLLKKYKELNAIIGIINHCLDYYKSTDDILEKTSVLLNEQIIKYKETIKNAKICPFCYEPITQTSIKHIEIHLEN